MKKIILALAMFFSITTANAWYAGGDVTVTTSNIQWRVVNTSGMYMQCTGTLYGQTQMGQTGNEYVSVIVPPGAVATRQLYTWGSAYFVSGWADINCVM
jgi:hypothetical protein